MDVEAVLRGGGGVSVGLKGERGGVSEGGGSVDIGPWEEGDIDRDEPRRGREWWPCRRPGRPCRQRTSRSDASSASL